MFKTLRPTRLIRPLFSLRSWRSLADYIGLGNYRNIRSIRDAQSLEQFIATRASHVAQTSLYGYLRTRAGTRFPELFEREDMLVSINIAKWHIWLACLSDLCIFFGQLIRESGDFSQDEIHEVMVTTLDRMLQETGTPGEAGPDFTHAKEAVILRINTCDWSTERDDDTIFSHSPDALVYWAPIAHELKERDEEIVLNSIRFRWIEVRRSARRLLDAEALMALPHVDNQQACKPGTNG